MHTALIGLGSNLGDREQAIQHAADALGDRPGVERLQLSRLLHTKPIGGPDGQGEFVNAAIKLDYRGGTARQLLTQLHDIERQWGRQRRERWAARTLDLDVLIFGTQRHHAADLQIPHPRMPWRRFVLEVAVEVGPEMIHVDTGWTIERLHRNLTPTWIAVHGASEECVNQIAQRCSLQVVDMQTVAGPQPPASLELLDRVTHEVRQLWNQAPQRPLISAAWPDTAIATSRHQHPAWPSLRVLWPGNRSTAEQQYLRWLSGLPDQGPRLILPDNISEDGALDEVCAAVQSISS